MAIRDKIRKNVAPYLQPGETVQAVIPAQTVSAYFSLISFWIILLQDAYRDIIVTDRRIFVCKTSRISFTKIKGVEGELPRQIQIGPPHGLWYKTDALGGVTLHIHKRFHKDIQAADAALQQGGYQQGGYQQQGWNQPQQ